MADDAFCQNLLLHARSVAVNLPTTASYCFTIRTSTARFHATETSMTSATFATTLTHHTWHQRQRTVSPP